MQICLQGCREENNAHCCRGLLTMRKARDKLERIVAHCHIYTYIAESCTSKNLCRFVFAKLILLRQSYRSWNCLTSYSYKRQKKHCANIKFELSSFDQNLLRVRLLYWYHKSGWRSGCFIFFSWIHFFHWTLETVASTQENIINKISKYTRCYGRAAGSIVCSFLIPELRLLSLKLSRLFSCLCGLQHPC